MVGNLVAHMSTYDIKASVPYCSLNCLKLSNEDVQRQLVKFSLEHETVLGPM